MKKNIPPIEDHSSDIESNSSSRERRRALLATVSAAGVVGASKLPSQWARPVIDHAILPAHATSTLVTFTTDCAVSCSVEGGSYSSFIQSSGDPTLYEIWSANVSITNCVDEFGDSSSTLVFNTPWSSLGFTDGSITTNSTYFPDPTNTDASASFSDVSVCEVTEAS